MTVEIRTASFVSGNKGDPDIEVKEGDVWFTFTTATTTKSEYVRYFHIRQIHFISRDMHFIGVYIGERENLEPVIIRAEQFVNDFKLVSTIAI